MRDLSGDSLKCFAASWAIWCLLGDLCPLDNGASWAICASWAMSHPPLRASRGPRFQLQELVVFLHAIAFLGNIYTTTTDLRASRRPRFRLPTMDTRFSSSRASQVLGMAAANPLDLNYFSFLDDIIELIFILYFFYYTNLLF